VLNRSNNYRLYVFIDEFSRDNFNFVFSVPILRFLFCATAKIERTNVFRILNYNFSVSTFSVTTRDALTPKTSVTISLEERCQCTFSRKIQEGQDKRETSMLRYKCLRVQALMERCFLCLDTFA
jgi:hypothetical protein